MIDGLARFLAELRREGLAASPAEWLDALRAIERAGIEDRERFRVALRATLVKRSHLRSTFDVAFERFFAPPAWGSAGRERKRRGAGEGEPRRRRASRTESAGVSGRPDPRREPAPPRAAEAASRPAELRRVLDRVREGGPERRGRLRHVVVEERAEREAGRVGAAHRPQPARDPARRDLHRRMSVEAEREIAAQLPRMLERIRLRSGRRLVRAKRGRAYLRGVFRENLTRDGVPFVIPQRRIRPRRSRVVLLVDVSWSVARAAGLFLSLAHELVKAARPTRTLLFVDRAVDATEQVEQWLRRGRSPAGSLASGLGAGAARPAPGSGIVRGGLSFADLLSTLPGLNLSAPSDYGRAFDSLRRSRARPPGRDTLLLVLGDGRTNRFDPQAWVLEELTARCGATIWLVPEAIEAWGSGDSALDAYLPHVDVAVEARDLRGLAAGVRELVRRL